MNGVEVAFIAGAIVGSIYAYGKIAKGGAKAAFDKDAVAANAEAKKIEAQASAAVGQAKKIIEKK